LVAPSLTNQVERSVAQQLATMVKLAFVLLALPAASVKLSLKNALSRDLGTSMKERPIAKVVRMLTDMKDELTAELEDDKAVQETLDCWCTTNENEKSQAVEVAERRIEELYAMMGEAGAKMKELKSKRKSVQEELYADQKALDESEELRMKENKEFHGEETDLLGAIDACKSAIEVLSRSSPQLAQVKVVAQALQLARVQDLMLKTSSSAELGRIKAEALKQFITGVNQAPSFLAIPGMQSYAPQSGQVFGIIKQMKEDFENDLSSTQKTEATSAEQFQLLKNAKTDEIDTGKKQIETIDAQLASLAEKNAEAAKELEDTEAQVALDKTFLVNLKKKCSVSDADFQARVKARMEEISAVEDSIKILNSDDSFEAFDNSVNSFLQVSSVSAEQEQMQRKRVVNILQKAADSSDSPQISLIALSAQLDTFAKVKEEIGKMVVELGKQQKDEVVQRDWCIKSVNGNKLETAAAYDKKDGLTSKIADLEQSVKSFTAEIESSTAAIAEMQIQMKRRSESREAENADYQQTVTDQRLTQMILQKVIDRMSQVYADFLQHDGQPGAPHIQTSGTDTDPGNGPAKFKKYEENAGGKKIIAMLDEVMAESKTMEDTAIRGEENAQAAYESFMKDSNKSIIKTAQKINDMTEANAKAKADLGMANSDFKQTMSNLDDLNTEVGDLGKSCNYLLRNFDARQEARTGEIAALNEAVNILSGMN